MEFQNLLYSVEEGIALVTINRPKALNALNRETIAELAALMDELSSDEDVHAIILTGAGEKAFVAGADIKELAANSALESNDHSKFGQSLMDLIEDLGVPTIAAINGFALGGGLELAMACTFRLASSQARLGQPEVNLGIIPGFGGTQRLPRLVGQGRALHMVLTGDPIDAQTALNYGLVTEVHPPDALLDAARKLAKKLVAKSFFTLRVAEETVRHGMQMALAESLAYEASQFGLAAAAQDYQEGMTAFLEKRKAEFHGR
jgi:enoyl-CoA hydratase